MNSEREQPRVDFPQLRVESPARENETILDVARRVEAPIANSCGAVGICLRCRVRVIEGVAALSPPTSIERRARADGALAADERLACQAVVRGTCAIGTSYWGGNERT